MIEDRVVHATDWLLSHNVAADKRSVIVRDGVVCFSFVCSGEIPLKQFVPETTPEDLVDVLDERIVEAIWRRLIFGVRADLLKKVEHRTAAEEEAAHTRIVSLVRGMTQTMMG